MSPGDRVVAINTDLSGPILAPPDIVSRPFSFPDGPLRRNQVYHIFCFPLRSPSTRISQTSQTESILIHLSRSSMADDNDSKLIHAVQ